MLSDRKRTAVNRRPDTGFRGLHAFIASKLPLNLKRFYSVSFLSLGVFLALQTLPARSADQEFITIGTGGVTGVYYPVGGATCQIVNQTRAEHGVRCSVESSNGSITNIEGIKAGNLDFGFVQSDWLHHAYHGTSKFEESGPFRDFRSVFSLHKEVATVVVAADSDYQIFHDLKGARVNIGAEGSGSAATWKTLVDRLGWSETDQKQLSALKASAVADALCSGRIDAYFVLIGHPAGLIEDTKAQCGLRFLGFDGEDVNAFLEEYPYYRAVDIPVDQYGLSVPVHSFGVVATFVTSAKMPKDIVTTLVSTVYDNFDQFKKLHPALDDIARDELAVPGASVPIHKGALNFYRDKGLLTQDKAPSKD